MGVMISMLFFAVAACAPHRDSHEMIMDEIERSVSLPQGARPLSAYGRSYAFEKPGRVVAVFLAGLSPRFPGGGCDVVTATGSKPCTSQEAAEFKESFIEFSRSRLPAGQRRWLNDAKKLPFISDGGCSQITIEYDLASRRFLDIVCNGVD